MPFLYRAFGCLIRSEIELPELVGVPDTPAAGEADVAVRCRRVDRSSLVPLGGGFAVRLFPGDAVFAWEGVGAFHARGGTSITVDAADGVEADVLRLPLLGVVFSALLSQRGHTVLHGSAVGIGGEVVGFLGNKGAGKSTTAGAFHRSGYQVVTDDVLAVQYVGRSGRYEALPAYSQLKLWPQAAAHVVERSAQLRTLHGGVQKRVFTPAGEFPTEPLPLARLYVLGWGTETVVEPLPQAEAFLHSVAHTFTHRYASAYPEALPSLFGRCRRLVQDVPVRQLVRRPDLEGLRAVVEAVEQDLTERTALVGDDHGRSGGVDVSA